MQLALIDVVIVVSFLVLMLAMGFWIAGRAGKNVESYFLGGKQLHWSLLGLSNASGMMDITSALWLVSLTVIYGIKSVWFPWVWPVFNQIFLMVFLSIWLRRSGVITGAEWISTRFGTGRGGEFSRLAVVVFALFSVIGFLAYAFKGIGKFSAEFMPWELSESTYALILMGITMVYVVLGGMYSVVFTDIIQFLVLTTVSITVGVIAMIHVSPADLAGAVPEGWFSFLSGWKVDLDWSELLPSAAERVRGDGYSYFYLFLMMMLFKGTLASLAGPAPNYDMQRILAARTPRDAAKMSGLVSLVIPFPRYFMVVGIAVLALVYYGDTMREMGSALDFERILPLVIRDFLPAGLVGLILVGFLSAFMSTFDSTVNAGAAYLVQDVFRRYIRSDLSDRAYIVASYLASVLVVACGIALGFFIDTVDSITQWLFTALWGGYTAANVLKWYWWRLNGLGYFAGMMVGIASAVAVPLLLPDLHLMYAFPIIFAVSGLASVVASCLTRPEPMDVLTQFYRTVRPWGWWGPVLAAVRAEEPTFVGNKDFGRDSFNVAVGICWQMGLMVLPFFIVLKLPWPMLGTILFIALTSLILKKNWLDRLPAS